MRPLLHKEGISHDCENREGPHDETHEFARMAGNRGREPSGAVKCCGPSAGRSSRHFSSPECLRSLQCPGDKLDEIACAGPAPPFDGQPVTPLASPIRLWIATSPHANAPSS